MLSSSDIQTIITVLSIVFAAGIIYGKIGTVEKKVDKMEGYGERLTKVETEVANIKQRK